MAQTQQDVPQALGELLGAGLVVLAVREAARRTRWDLVAWAGLSLLRWAAGPELRATASAAGSRLVH